MQLDQSQLLWQNGALDMGNSSEVYDVVVEDHLAPSSTTLPQIVVPLKGDEDQEQQGDGSVPLQSEKGRKPRKNSGCSMNFLNSFINMGFIPEQPQYANQAPDPYYQAIMKAGKLGLQDMYLCEENGLETIAEIDQNNLFMNQQFLEPPMMALGGISDINWAQYYQQPVPSNNGAFIDQQTAMAQFYPSQQPGDDPAFEYFNYVNTPGSEFFADQL